MKDFRYILEKGSKKVMCFGCGKKRATAYIDTKTGQRLPTQYCRCDRESKCTYFLSPYHDGYAKSQNENNYSFNTYQHSSKWSPTRQEQTKEQTYFPFEILAQTLTGYEANRFTIELSKLIGIKATTRQVEKYYVGTSDRWSGSTTFPFINIKGHIRAIQVKLFDETLHTAKHANREGELVPCIAYHEHSLKYKLEKQGQQIPDWLNKYLKSEKKVDCFFGEHLINKPENKAKTIAIVEAPKTAIIADAYFNQWFGEHNFLWLAVGGLSYLTEDRCKVLSGKKVLLYPDLNAFEKWKVRAKELSHIANFKVSDLLETKATEEERSKGLDLADYLLKIPYSTPEKTIQTVLEICSNDLTYYPCDTVTSKEMGSLSIITVNSHGKIYDVLFDEMGELVIHNERQKDVAQIQKIFNKQFQPISFDGVLCWAHCANN